MAICVSTDLQDITTYLTMYNQNPDFYFSHYIVSYSFYHI